MSVANNIRVLVPAILFIGIFILCDRADTMFHHDMAPKVQVFALKHFDEIDADHDEVITDDELKQAVERFAGEERRILVYMREQQSEVGHVSAHTPQPTVFLSLRGNSRFRWRRTVRTMFTESDQRT
jgi:hypothetical protein